MSKHVAFYISNDENKKQLVKDIISGNYINEIKGLVSAVFSEITLSKFIEEELRHGEFYISTETRNSLKNSSQGERRKALLNYIIAQNPDYIIADNVLDSLDINSQKEILNTFCELSSKHRIIQIVNRGRDILPFIETVYKLPENKLIPVQSILEFDKDVPHHFIKTLPQFYKKNKIQFKSLVRFNKVFVSYLERPIVNSISWEIKPGEFWQLIGPNGSGKSTLLTLISGDNPKAYSQDITIFGMKKGSGESIWDIKEHIGYFSSELSRSFKRSDTVENMIISGFLDSVGLYKKPSDRQILLAHQWLLLLNMDKVKNKSFRFLSEGHKRLVLIARAMVKQPALLILDEPTNGLDDSDLKLFTNLINKIAKESDTAIIYVSHRKEEFIKPDYVYELVPGQNGSIGKVVNVH